MPTLAEHQSAEFVKMLYIGDSGTAKTGSLVSLVKAGYDLRIIDFDNGLDALVHQIQQQCPTRLASVQYQTYQDRYKTNHTGSTILDGTPKALMKAGRAIDRWPDDKSRPREWGPKKVLVLDSITGMGRCAFAVERHSRPMAADPRSWYFGAQGYLEDIAASITSKTFETNVIMISHIDTKETRNSKGEVISSKKYVSTIGQALGGKFPRHINSMIQAEKSGSGTRTKRIIRTLPTVDLDLKNPVPTNMPGTLPLNEGLATIFAVLKGEALKQ